MGFIANIEEIRKRARRHIEEARSPRKDYALDRDQVVRILNDALATEYICVLRYRFHSDTNQGSRHLYFSNETPGRTEREQVGS